MSPAHGLLALLLAALPLALPAAQLGGPARSELPAAVWPQFDNVAHQLGKGGRERECKHLLEIVGELGMPKAQLSKLQSACLAELQKASRAADSLPDATKRLKLVARQIAPLLEKAPAAEKLRLAGLLLRLDDSLDEAHVAAGDVQEGTSWVSAQEQLTRKRRGEILEAIDKAAQLAPDVESGA